MPRSQRSAQRVTMSPKTPAVSNSRNSRDDNDVISIPMQSSPDQKRPRGKKSLYHASCWSVNQMRSNSPFHSDFLDSAQGKENISLQEGKENVPPDSKKKPKANHSSLSQEWKPDEVSMNLWSHYYTYFELTHIPLFRSLILNLILNQMIQTTPL
jgi:hypothetical protein